MSVLLVFVIGAVLGFVGAMPILGPVAVMVISRGIEGRFDEAKKLGFGAALAEGTYAGVAFATFTTLFARHPAVLPISRGLASIILFAVGVSFVRYTPKPIEAVTERKAKSALGLGFLTSGFNPTILVMWTTAATFIHGQGLPMSTWMAVPFGLSAATGIACWYITLVGLMTKYHSRLPVRGLRIAIRLMGGVLFGLGAWTLISVFR